MDPINQNPESVIASKPQEQETWWDVFKFVCITLIIVLPIRAYVAQPFIVSGESMVSTFQDGQYLIVDEMTYHFRNPERGEVIIFRYPKDPSKFFIKRVIGIPGDSVKVAGGHVYVNGIETEEPYLDAGVVTTTDGPFLQSNTPVTLGKDQYFAMGDNRPRSLDSRSWGVVPRANIKGRVLLRLFPFNSLAYLPGDDAHLQ